MRHENSNRLFNYWNSLRDGRSAPDRREIEPSDIRYVLGDTFILELDQNFKTLSFRLAGTRLCNAYGHELKSVGFLSIWAESDNLNVYNTVTSVFEDAAPCVMAFDAETQNNHWIECEMLLLPLLNGSDQASRVLGSISVLGNSNWVGNEPIIQNHLKMARLIELEEGSEVSHELPNLDPVADIENYNLKKVGHLTIIDGGID